MSPTPSGSTPDRHLAPGVRARTVTLRGVRSSYLAGGRGPAVLLLHGNGGSARRWELSLPHWNDAGVSFYVPDLPGFGGTEPFRQRPDLERYTVFVGDFISQVIPESEAARVAIVGHGFGALIAANFAVRFPRCVRRLVLADAVGARPRDSIVRRLSRRTRMRTWLAQALCSPRLFPFLVSRVLYRPARVPSWAIEALRRDFVRSAAFLDLLDHLSPEAASAYERVSVPTLVLWGAQDRLVRPRHGARLARRMSGAAWEALDGAGHLSMMDRPAEFVAAAARFLHARERDEQAVERVVEGQFSPG